MHNIHSCNILTEILSETAIRTHQTENSVVSKGRSLQKLTHRPVSKNLAENGSHINRTERKSASRMRRLIFLPKLPSSLFTVLNRKVPIVRTELRAREASSFCDF